MFSLSEQSMPWAHAISFSLKSDALLFSPFIPVQQRESFTCRKALDTLRLCSKVSLHIHDPINPKILKSLLLPGTSSSYSLRYSLGKDAAIRVSCFSYLTYLTYRRLVREA